MESNIENIEDLHFSKIKYNDETDQLEISEKMINDLNLINNNSLSHLVTTNLYTDFNNLTDLDCFDIDFSLIQNHRMNNFQFIKKKDRIVSFDNTFDNINSYNFTENFENEKFLGKKNQPINISSISPNNEEKDYNTEHKNYLKFKSTKKSNIF